MTREMMISELLKKGYNVAPKDTVKNGVLKKGIAFLSAPHSITIFHVDELLITLKQRTGHLTGLYKSSQYLSCGFIRPVRFYQTRNGC